MGFLPPVKTNFRLLGALAFIACGAPTASFNDAATAADPEAPPPERPPHRATPIADGPPSARDTLARAGADGAAVPDGPVLSDAGLQSDSSAGEPLADASPSPQSDAPGIRDDVPASEGVIPPLVRTLKSKYPSLYNEDLPHTGLFYGSVFSCFNHSLVRLGDDSSGSGSSNKAGKNVSVRFRAERTGNVVSLAYNNRYDPNGNGYSTGDGGRIHIELRADDGTAYHYPSNVVIGMTNSHTPGNWTGQFKTLSMKSPVAVEAGTLYHAVFVQEKSNYASMNGSRQYGRGPIFGPYYGDDTGATIGSLGGKWHPFGSHAWKAGANRSYTQGYVAIGYEDGITIGTGGMCYHQNYAKIGGTNRIRENFIVEGPTRNVNGVWFRVGRKPGNAQPIILELKDASGKVLISRSVPASQISEGTFVHDFDILRTQGPIEWAYVDFGSVVALLSGARYTVELRSPSSTADGYTTHAFPDTEAWWKLGDRNQWVNAKAEISTNGGSSWGGLDQGDQDFGFGFTLDGGPNSIQSIANFKDGVNGGL